MRLMIVPLLAAGVALGGCAKKSYVQREVGEVNQKVDAVSAEVGQTQERVRQNEVEIAKVDKNSQAGIAEAKSSRRVSRSRNAAPKSCSADAGHSSAPSAGRPDSSVKKVRADSGACGFGKPLGGRDEPTGTRRA